MITGDNPLTAVHVARDVEIVDRDVFILDAREGGTSESGMYSFADKKTQDSTDTFGKTSLGALSTSPRSSLSTPTTRLTRTSSTTTTFALQASP
jgi:magnesium-transporting ATPase (P-type)